MQTYFVFLTDDDGRYDEIGNALFASDDLSAAVTFAHEYFEENHKSIMVIQPEFNYVREHYLLRDYEEFDGFMVMKQKDGE